MRRTGLSLLLCALLLTMSALSICGKPLTTPCLAAGEPADFQYRVRVLVRDFRAPGAPQAWGELAAETVAAAIEERGLAQSLRPTVEIESEWGVRIEGVKVDDVHTGRRHYRARNEVDVYAVPEESLVTRQKTAPVSDVYIEGTLSTVETTCWLKADIFERGTRRKLKSASAWGEGEKGLLTASQKVAAQLETVYASGVISHRAEAILRSVALERMKRPLAAAKLEQMHKDWPDALEPAAARLSLETGRTVPDPKALVMWSAAVVESLRTAGPESQRFLLRLNVDPYDILADQYEAEDKLMEAASVHLEGGENYPGDRRSHWLKAARLKSGLGLDREAVTAYEAALKLKPLDPETNLELGLLFEKAGEDAQAARCLKRFLSRVPESARAEEIRAKLDALAPAP